MPKTRDALSFREAEFVRLFLTGPPGTRGNAAQAYLAAGYAAREPGSRASELRRKPRIQAAILATTGKADITAQNVLNELRDVAFAPVEPASIRMRDKLAALTTLAKHLGLLKEPEDVGKRPLFPRGFFEALITRDPSKMEG